MTFDPERLAARQGDLVDAVALREIERGITLAADACGELIALLQARCEAGKRCYATLLALERSGTDRWSVVVENGEPWSSPLEPRPTVGRPLQLSGRTAFTHEGRCFGMVAGVVAADVPCVGARTSRGERVVRTDRRTGNFILLTALDSTDAYWTIHVVDQAGRWAPDEMS